MRIKLIFLYYDTVFKGFLVLPNLPRYIKLELETSPSCLGHQFGEYGRLVPVQHGLMR